MEMEYASYAAESILLTEHFPRRFVKVIIARMQKIVSQMNII
nr:MAG TPA: hypothetical protein [Caudoviricetes sp.]